ncbi:cytochrome b/b6 domain-containing protein [Microbacterium insulae]|uniref:Cytochrome b/b6 domain-containing protein n=1 Tax=Microbacterium insulae TaxID=483014 RepID=A0ABW3AFH5_9MICO
MATFGGTIRRGLPRRPGGEPWPPAGEAPAGVGAAAEGAAAAVTQGVADRSEGAVAEVDSSRGSSRQSLQDDVQRMPQTAAVVPAPASAASAGDARRHMRRGLPRVPGGEPWPPASVVPDAEPPETAAPAAEPAPRTGAGAAALAAGIAATAPSPSPRVQTPRPAPEHAPVLDAAAPAVPDAAAPTDADAPAASDARAMRRGLPRVAGGEPWPPPGLFAASAAAPASAPAASAAPAPAPETDTFVRDSASELSVSHESGTLETRTESARTDYSTPLPFTRTVWEGAAARTRPEPKAEPQRIGPFTRLQWAGIVIVGGGGLLYAGLMVVFAVQWLLSTTWGTDFLAAYPGEYHLPEGAPVGFPAWLGWQHFFNVFLMVLIIRSGLQVRTEKRPSVFWSPRWNGKRKISLNLWFHQSLDILWIVNGVIFVVLLFVTGQWMRIIPTSWEVFPNAVSAALQYVSLDWPTENGWVNYNALQQLAYFTTVFVAAPLAIITGVRMSGIWPKNATALNKAYPVEWARAVHFPVMLYFVLFIFVHVVLVFATGALRNLNHMYAAQGSTDPDAYAMNWTGFWIFALSMLVIVAAWIAARPLVLAPIARLFGKVSGR